MSGDDITVVIPARNAARTLATVLQAVNRELPGADLVVVDDGSTDATTAIARQANASVVTPERGGSAGGARNRGWAEARHRWVVFLDSDAIPAPGWGEGIHRAVTENPDAIIGCARWFSPTASWGWVAHLEVESPYLPAGEPRRVPFVSTYCMIVPRELDLRFDESYGAEDEIFCIDAADREIPIMFDPRFLAIHDHGRSSFASLREQQARMAYSLARVGAMEPEGRHKRVLSRVPVHYFLLARLPIIHRRLEPFPTLRREFLRVLPQMIVGEWSLGIEALRYTVRRPRYRTPAADASSAPD